MNILCSTDHNYIMPTGVMLTSLLMHHAELKVHIHVMINQSVTETDRRSLHRVVSISTKADISFYLMEDKLFREFPIGENYQSAHITTMATYYRLYATKVLPQTIDKVLYLDGDIIVRSSLHQLWNIDMDDIPIGGVPDSTYSSVVHYNRLRYPVSQGYFNAGVLLINLKYWREHNVLCDFLQIVKEKKEVLACHDQDVLNYIFRKNKLLLPLKYNMQNCFLYRRDMVPLPWTFDEQIADGQKSPVIIHYVTAPKPWHSDCRHPYKQEFVKYRDMTEWKNMKEHRYYHGRSRLYWTVLRAAIRFGLSKVSNDPDTFYVSFSTN